MAGKSWIAVRPDSPFSLANIPFGVFHDQTSRQPRPACAIGTYLIDLRALVDANSFEPVPDLHENCEVFRAGTLNFFARLGRKYHARYRAYLQALLREDTPYPAQLRDNLALRKKAIKNQADVTMCVPMDIGDYTDFYAGRNHAYNVGVLFRGPENALQPNYDHLPVGYHGRVSSIQCSGRPVKRPCGQILDKPGDSKPIFAASRKFDFELELAAFLCSENPQGEPISINSANEFIFGYVLMNDWSSRDIQSWEYVPLGPFNGKNFATSISPWIVLSDALEPFRCRLAASRNTDLLPYLRQDGGPNGFDIAMTISISAGGTDAILSKSNSRFLNFSFEQMLAHHTVSGCNMRTGDLLGSGTISGSDEQSLGSMLEMTKNGRCPLLLENGRVRTFLEDGDEVVMTGICGSPGGMVGFGSVRGTIVAAVLPDLKPLS